MLSFGLHVVSNRKISVIPCRVCILMISEPDIIQVSQIKRSFIPYQCFRFREYNNIVSPQVIPTIFITREELVLQIFDIFLEGLLSVDNFFSLPLS